MNRAIEISVMLTLVLLVELDCVWLIGWLDSRLLHLVSCGSAQYDSKNWQSVVTGVTVVVLLLFGLLWVHR
jgi:hypothetical protein